MATLDSPVSGVGNGFHDEDSGTPIRDLPTSEAPVQNTNDGVPKEVDTVLYSDVCLPHHF